jgi:hypothetical protein
LIISIDAEKATSPLLEYPSLATPPTTGVGEDAGAKGTLLHCWWECKLVQPLWKKNWRLLKKLTIDLPFDPAIPLLGIYPKDCDTGYSRGPAHPVYCGTIHNSQVIETAKMPHH